MPGPVSDSHDLEFGTAENARIVREGVEEMKEWLDDTLRSEPLDILSVVQDRSPGRTWKAEHDYLLDERRLRILRFAVNRALESL